MSIASAKLPTPIYNTLEIPPLKKDDQGRFMALETIAFPGTVFKIIRQMSDNVVQVETPEYPSSAPLYVDSRFLTFGNTTKREKKLPSQSTILKWMESCKGSSYLWGGNWNQGIPEMLEFYPELKTILEGVDCSGLLYQATNGITPRNTSQLISFGEELKIQHLPLDQIQLQVKPLDIMVWRGHVLIVLSPNTFIESRIDQGVVVTDFQTRFKEAVEKLQGKPFYFRRWFNS